MRKTLTNMFGVCVLVAVSVIAKAEDKQDKSGKKGSDGKRPIKVFILAGQSNAVGHAHVDDYKQGKAKFPKAHKDQPDIRFWCGARSWRKLQVSSSGSFGPEISFARDMASKYPMYRIAIIKHAKNSTGISRSADYNDYIVRVKNDNGWNWSPEGHHNGRLRSHISRALKALDREKATWELVGFLWMQGEHEAGISPSTAKDYGKLLTLFIKKFRERLKRPALPFFIGEINSHTWRFGDVAREQQAMVCQKDKNAVLIKTTDLSRKGRGGAAHFDADGMLELGSRFAKAVIQFTEEKSRKVIPQKEQNPQ